MTYFTQIIITRAIFCVMFLQNYDLFYANNYARNIYFASCLCKKSLSLLRKLWRTYFAQSITHHTYQDATGNPRLHHPDAVIGKKDIGDGVNDTIRNANAKDRLQNCVMSLQNYDMQIITIMQTIWCVTQRMSSVSILAPRGSVATVVYLPPLAQCVPSVFA